MEGYILAGIPPFVSVGPLEKPNCLANPPRLPRGELCCDSGNTLTSEVYSSMDVSAMNSPRTENTAMILIASHRPSHTVCIRSSRSFSSLSVFSCCTISTGKLRYLDLCSEERLRWKITHLL